MVKMLVGLFLVFFFCMIVVLFLGGFIWGIWILVDIVDRINTNKINPWIDKKFGESKE